ALEIARRFIDQIERHTAQAVAGKEKAGQYRFEQIIHRNHVPAVECREPLFEHRVDGVDLSAEPFFELFGCYHIIGIERYVQLASDLYRGTAYRIVLKRFLRDARDKSNSS